MCTQRVAFVNKVTRVYVGGLLKRLKIMMQLFFNKKMLITCSFFDALGVGGGKIEDLVLLLSSASQKKKLKLLFHVAYIDCRRCNTRLKF